MLGILTRALFYTAVFNAGIIIGGIYTPNVVSFARSMIDNTVLEQPLPSRQERNKKPRKILVRATV